jgi:hypothetical protein
MPADEEAQAAGGAPSESAQAEPTQAEPARVADSPDDPPEAQPAAQELGRVDRPPVDRFQGMRRLLLVPLMFAPPADPEGEMSEGRIIYGRYWEQVRTQIDALASGLGGLHRIYHESLVEGGEAGLSYLQMAYHHAHAMIQVRCQAGATLEATEDIDLITETLDLQRCLMIPFTNDSVAGRIQDWLAQSTHTRYKHIGNRIDLTLQPDETGLLLINERHQVQFPNDIEVFYVAPPALDEYRRWLQNWAAAQQQAAEAGIGAEAEASYGSSGSE